MRTLFLALLVLACTLSCRKKKSDVQPAKTEPLGARFNVTGSMVDASTTTTFTGYYPFEITLSKTGTNQGTMIPTLLGIPGHLIKAGTSTSYYGNFGPLITLDAGTNKITAIVNSYGQPASNGRSASLDPSGVNAWNPTTKEIKIKYWMDEPAVATPHRVSFDETWTYVGP